MIIYLLGELPLDDRYPSVPLNGIAELVKELVLHPGDIPLQNLARELAGAGVPESDDLRARESLAVVPPPDTVGDPPQEPRAHHAVVPHHLLHLLAHGLRQAARPRAAEALLVVELLPPPALLPLPLRHVLAVAEAFAIVVGRRCVVHPQIDAAEPVGGDDDAVPRRAAVLAGVRRRRRGGCRVAARVLVRRGPLVPFARARAAGAREDPPEEVGECGGGGHPPWWLLREELGEAEEEAAAALMAEVRDRLGEEVWGSGMGDRIRRGPEHRGEEEAGSCSRRPSSASEKKTIILPAGGCAEKTKD